MSTSRTTCGNHSQPRHPYSCLSTPPLSPTRLGSIRAIIIASTTVDGSLRTLPDTVDTLLPSLSLPLPQSIHYLLILPLLLSIRLYLQLTPHSQILHRFSHPKCCADSDAYDFENFKNFLTLNCRGKSNFCWLVKFRGLIVPGYPDRQTVDGLVESPL
ncbi:hypothetical protein GALMADRAFT_147262 [Galerina marginata CBS 339.88]|uniref:Uncharacterized protein n=1 Tax=Galerina marginata (strain CBS 339.88) TaxID=685588 RepID=A0A067SBC0_GALM3|nr:hypothetical protein GALMADRAFT_147262 [Galerina marginata CBS 339.88]